MSMMTKSRFSCRDFTGEPISDTQIGKLMEAFRWAPSSFNEQPWRLILASRRDEARFGQALSCLTEGNRGFASDAALLMFTLAVPTFAKNGKENPHAWHDVGLAVMCMTEQAVEDGLQCREMAGIDRQAIRRVFEVPEELEIVSAVAVGKPASPPPADRWRRPVEDLLFTPDPVPQPTESEAIVAAERYGDSPGSTPVPLPVDLAKQDGRGG